MKVVLLISSLLIGALSLQAQAALQSVHWKTDGDNKVTLDTATGIEWLDLTETDNKSYDQVVALLSTTLAGWRFPTAHEVHVMMSNHFSVLANYENTEYNVKTNTCQGASCESSLGKTFRTLFGATHMYYQSASDWSNISYGLFKDVNGGIDLSGFYRRNYWNGSFSTLAHNAALPTLTNSTPYTYAGWFLVSDGGLTYSSLANPEQNINNPAAPVNQVQPPPAPVPAPLAGIISALALLGLRRRNT